MSPAGPLAEEGTIIRNIERLGTRRGRGGLRRQARRSNRIDVQTRRGKHYAARKAQDGECHRDDFSRKEVGNAISAVPRQW